MTSNNLPPWLRASPVGFHIVDLLAFVRSPYKAPVSPNDPARRHWATEAAGQMVSRLFPHDPVGIAEANIMIYNKSRDEDRICPCCRRWYHVGEAPQAYSTLEAFASRHAPPSPADLENDEVSRENDLSGICSRACIRVMNSGNDFMFGHDIDGLSETQVEAMNPGIAHESGWVMRKATPEEQEALGGAKMLWFKVGE